MMKIKTSPVLDWLLKRYPDTPKHRAKQWILAGRVSVNGGVILKPHELIADPADTLKLGMAMPPSWSAVRAGKTIREFRCYTWSPPLS